MTNFQTFSVGRGSHAHLQVADPAVSRHHLELTVTSDGRYYAIDAASTAGTQVWRNQQWQRLRQDFIRKDEVLRLGETEVTVADLLARLGTR